MIEGFGEITPYQEVIRTTMTSNQRLRFGLWVLEIHGVVVSIQIGLPTSCVEILDRFET